MTGHYVIALDPDGVPWIVHVDDTPAIGPFDSTAQAELALAELEAAATREVVQ